MPKTKKQHNAIQIARRRAIIDAAKKVPCADCEEEFPLVCMDLHHKNGDGFAREGSFIRWAMSHGIPALEKEIAKCEAVCANCHRLRHLT